MLVITLIPFGDVEIEYVRDFTQQSRITARLGTEAVRSTSHKSPMSNFFATAVPSTGRPASD